MNMNFSIINDLWTDGIYSISQDAGGAYCIWCGDSYIAECDTLESAMEHAKATKDYDESRNALGCKPVKDI